MSTDDFFSDKSTVIITTSRSPVLAALITGGISVVFLVFAAARLLQGVDVDNLLSVAPLLVWISMTAALGISVFRIFGKIVITAFTIRCESYMSQREVGIKDIREIIANGDDHNGSTHALLASSHALVICTARRRMVIAGPKQWRGEEEEKDALIEAFHRRLSEQGIKITRSYWVY